MGNCIDVLLSPPQKKIRVLTFEGGEEEFKASTEVGNITTYGLYKDYKLVHHDQPKLPLPPDTKLKSGEVYYLVPHLGYLSGLPFPQKMVDGDSCGSRKVKIVVTKDQLELLMTSVELQPQMVAVHSFQGRGRCQKWKPSLATIPEYS